MTSAIQFLLMRKPHPSSTDLVEFLRAYPYPRRIQVMNDLIAAGVSPSVVGAASTFLASASSLNGGMVDGAGSKIWGFIALASAAASGYHGVKRHRGSVGWGAAWFMLGGVFPVLTPVVAVAQGYAKPMPR
jgi:hypothetical protein